MDVIRVTPVAKGKQKVEKSKSQNVKKSKRQNVETANPWSLKPSVP